ncbi:MAG: methionine biosynthesis protein MetW [Planctomycetes bacterium]|nr:methionine biosynthesis protein MetW [Planctomycetota bacterium]
MQGIDPSLDPQALQGLLAKTQAAQEAVVSRDGQFLRWQDRIIEEIIPPAASVLDLGCGNGELLARLIEIKQVHGQGVELDPEAVLQCVDRGVPVFQTDLDRGLLGFPDQSFDYVVLEETLQTLHRPIQVLEEMLRIGRQGIVSFPNFGYWRVRLELALEGYMPCTEWLPYQWYDTPNIHLFTIQDFDDWAKSNAITINSGHVLTEGEVRKLQPGDNLYAEEVLLVVEKNGK